MDAALIALVIVSLAAAVGFAVVTWRTMDEQRRRSAARVAALAAAIDGGPEADARQPVAVSSLFGTTAGAAVGGRPLIKAAVMGALAVALVVFVAMASRDHQQTSSVFADAAPLELVSMRHTRSGTGLTVTGLVRNPRAGATLDRIAAVVLVFDRQGTFVKSADAPLDFVTLGPGDESPFVVTLPDVGDVGRYRVSFRTSAGVVRHVDRRAAQVARSPAARSPVGGGGQVSAN